ncbi:Fc receptor-like protein 3 isoform X3 [Castor canadensis]|uniref:Fc receptor-like protein 3 isoform X3 n=1 Tax=Castor canadensis TaxID=51338 RepID=A0AC58KG16_CASCN
MTSKTEDGSAPGHEHSGMFPFFLSLQGSEHWSLWPAQSNPTLIKEGSRDMTTEVRLMFQGHTCYKVGQTDPPLNFPVSKFLPLPRCLSIEKEEAFEEGVPSKAVILLDPPWSAAFKGETVTLTCMNFHSPAQGDTTWYHGKDLLKVTSRNIRMEESGYYQCKTQRSSFSDPVLVEFSSDQLILQAPHPVFEGDTISLKCRGKEEKKTSDKIYYKNGKKLKNSYNTDSVTLKSVSRDNSEYHCTASIEFLSIFSRTITSKPLKIQVQELFLPPVLTATPSQPTEGGPVTLTCETQLPPQKSNVQLQFCFFRDGQILGSGCSSSLELQIPTMWRKDSGSYWCMAEAMAYRISKNSSRSQIHVQRIPVSEVILETKPPGGQLIEGENLVLICSVAKGTGTITFSWHKEGTRNLGRKTQHSLLAELQIPTVKMHDAGRYYCAADNNYGPIISKWIRVTVRSPVSHPVLTLKAPRAQAVVGDMVELHCKALRGSPPILYRFYHEDVIMGNSSAPSGGGVSFNFSLTVDHSGNYSCDANNGLGSQHSHRVSLKVIVPVSHPVLTLRPPAAQTKVGDVVELHCEALGGSPPIMYQFYHEDITLGNSLAPSGGGASFKLFLPTELVGNYSCDADNGLGAQHSEVMAFNITGITVGLLSFLGFAIAALLLYHFWTQRKSGGLSAAGTPSANDCQEPSLSRSCITNPQESSHSETLALMELQPVYNVNPEESHVVYSQIRNMRHTKENSANSARMHQKDKEPVVIYSELKKVYVNDSSRGTDHEDATGNYENVP